LKEMRDHDIEPDVITYNAVIAACFASKRFSIALKIAKFAQGKGHYHMLAEEKSLEWDLHDLQLAVSCMLIADSLLSIVRMRTIESSPFQDITVITGKGLGSGPEGPVLVTGVPRFLSVFSGPQITSIEGNEGRFLITKKSLESWSESSEFDRFNDLMAK